MCRRQRSSQRRLPRQRRRKSGKRINISIASPVRRRNPQRLSLHRQAARTRTPVIQAACRSRSSTTSGHSRAPRMPARHTVPTQTEAGTVVQTGMHCPGAAGRGMIVTTGGHTGGGNGHPADTTTRGDEHGRGRVVPSAIGGGGECQVLLFAQVFTGNRVSRNQSHCDSTDNAIQAYTVHKRQRSTPEDADCLPAGVMRFHVQLLHRRRAPSAATLEASLQTARQPLAFALASPLARSSAAAAAAPLRTPRAAARTRRFVGTSFPKGSLLQCSGNCAASSSLVMGRRAHQ